MLSTTVIVGGGFLALMAARGNLFTPNGFQSTGTIRLLVNPDGSFAAFLDEQEKQITSNKTIENVLPGEYVLRIQKDGFNTWQQRVSVSQGIITDVSVQLFPLSVPISQVTTTGVENFSIGRSGKVLYYATENTPIGSNIGIWRLSLENGGLLPSNPSPVKITNLVPGLREAVASNTYQLIPSPNDSKLILVIPTGVYLLDADRYNEPAIANKLAFTYTIDEIHWLNESTNLLIKSGNLLIDYDTDRKSATVITFQNDTAPIFTQASNTVYYVVNNRIYKYTAGTNQAVQLENIVLPENINYLDAGLLDSSLVLHAGNTLYFLDITSSTLTTLGNYQLRSIAPSGKDLVVSDGKDIYTVNINVSQVYGTVSVSQTKTEIKDQDAHLTVWAPNSVYFVYMDTVSKELKAGSRSGGSLNILIEGSEANVQSNYRVSGDSSFILVQLEDSNNSGRSNVYKLEL